MLQKGLKRIAGVDKSMPILYVGPREEHLADMYAVLAEKLLPDLHETTLPDRGEHLLLAQRSRHILKPASASAGRGGARGTQDQVVPGGVQRRTLAHDLRHAIATEVRGTGREHARAHLDNDALWHDHFKRSWCRERDSNPHGPCSPSDFHADASTYSAIPAKTDKLSYTAHTVQTDRRISPESESARMPSEILSRLRSIAADALVHARVPYSGHAEAAVLLLSDGSWIPGVLVEPASFSLSISSLVNAVTSAVALERAVVVASVMSRSFAAAARPYAAESIALRELAPAGTYVMVHSSIPLRPPTTRHSPFLSTPVRTDPTHGIQVARGVARRAYVPESDFPVGCVAQTRDGYIPGVNVVHPDWSRIFCAECNASGTCVSYGVEKVEALVLTCLRDTSCTPWAACRQLLVELAPAATIWMDHGSRRPRLVQPSDLLPASFGGEKLSSRT